MTKEKKVLSDKGCLIMRAAPQAEPLVRGIRSLGGIPYAVPLIAFRATELTENELVAVRRLSGFDWIVFTSQNGVRFFIEHLNRLNMDFPADVKVAAVGTKTERYLQKFGITPCFVPEEFTGDALAEELKERITENEQVCVVKGNLARDIVSRTLREKGATVHDLIVYETVLPEQSRKKLIETLKTNQIDVLLFTSPSTVRHFMEIVRDEGMDEVQNCIIACIGPVTKKALETYGMSVHICPGTYTSDALLSALKNYFLEKI